MVYRRILQGRPEMVATSLTRLASFAIAVMAASAAPAQV